MGGNSGAAQMGPWAVQSGMAAGASRPWLQVILAHGRVKLGLRHFALLELLGQPRFAGQVLGVPV